jgi:hypothetical protein
LFPRRGILISITWSVYKNHEETEDVPDDKLIAAKLNFDLGKYTTLQINMALYFTNPHTIIFKTYWESTKPIVMFCEALV